MVQWNLDYTLKFMLWPSVLWLSWSGRWVPLLLPLGWKWTKLRSWWAIWEMRNWSWRQDWQIRRPGGVKNMVTTYQTITQCCSLQAQNKNIHCYGNWYDHIRFLWWSFWSVNTTGHSVQAQWSRKRWKYCLTKIRMWWIITHITHTQKCAGSL